MSIFQANYFIWTLMKAEQAVIVNKNGMYIIGIKLKSVLSKNLQDHVHQGNILLIIQPLGMVSNKISI